MIFKYINNVYSTTDLVIVALVMVMALVFHNVFQSYIASRYGDANPKYAGFMSFDIQRHLDPIGVLFLFVFGFGYPNPIPTNSRNYRGRGTQEAWVWLSGPLAYLIVAFVATLAAAIFSAVDSPVLARSFILASSASVLHAVINLFPVFPLDGAKAALAWGNPSLRRFVQQIASFQPFGFLIFFLILSYAGVLDALQSLFQGVILTLVGLIPGL